MARIQVIQGRKHRGQWSVQVIQGRRHRGQWSVHHRVKEEGNTSEHCHCCHTDQVGLMIDVRAKCWV